MTRVLPILLVAALSFGAQLAGCSGCGAPPPGGEGEGEGEGDPAVLSEQLCEIWTRGEIEFTLSFFIAPPDRCQASEVPKLDPTKDTQGSEKQSCQNTSDPVRAMFDLALKNKGVTFHKDAIDACSAVDASDPTQAQNGGGLPATCDGAKLFTPNRKTGDECQQDWECPDGTHCEADPLNQQKLTCLAPAKVGEACADTANLPTAPDVANSPRTCDTGLACSGNKCVASAPLPNGADCSQGGTCGTGLFCSQSTGKCTTLVATGGACDPTDQNGSECSDAAAVCGPGSKCVLPVADGSACNVASDVCKSPCSTCRPTTAGGTTTQCLDRGGTGDACATTNDCVHNDVCDPASHKCVDGGVADAACGVDSDCKAGFVCTNPPAGEGEGEGEGAGEGEGEGEGATAQHCVAQPDVGQACSATTTTECKTGSCNGTTCVAGNVGDTCGDDSNCVSPNVCDATTLKCRAASATGPCSVSNACDATTVCDDSSTPGVCKALPKVGDPCVGSQQVCDTGDICDPNTTKCVALKDAGATCTDDSECKSGACANGQCTAVGAGCGTSKDFFPIFVVLSVALPVSRRFRSLRAVRR